MIGLLSPLIIFFCIILILEINLSNGVDGFILSIGTMMRKHFFGFLIILYFVLYTFSWGVHGAGHFCEDPDSCNELNKIKEFKLFPTLDRSTNYVATLAIFYFLYSGLFLFLNKYWLNRKL